ncbi:MAG: hypothetical protein JWN64_757 [Parcubacteria group bacterium]|nr:hypothetical protein [Parcubacteria group bacterium]
MKNFFRTLVSSIYNPSFYAEIPARRLNSSIKYFVGLSFLLALVTTIVFIPGIFSFFSQATIDQAVGQYPDDLQLSVENGIASTTAKEPYFVAATAGQTKTKNLVVIDTQTPYTISQLEEYSTYVLVKKDAVVIEQEDGQQRIMPLKDIGNFTLTKEIVRAWGGKLSSYLIPGGILTTILALLFFTVLNLFALIYLLVIGLVVFLIAKLMKRTWGYKDSYKAAIHAATFAEIVAAILLILHLPMPPFSYSILLLLVLVVNLSAYRPKAPEADKPAV